MVYIYQEFTPFLKGPDVGKYTSTMEDVRLVEHGSLNVPIFHITQPLDSIRYMVYNGYYKVMSNIPKMGHLTTPVESMQIPIFDDFHIRLSQAKITKAGKPDELHHLDGWP